MERYRLVEKATMQCLIKTTARKYRDMQAISRYNDESSSISYGMLERKANAVAAFLRTKGCRPHDNIMILGESCPGWAVAYFGITCAGMTAVTVLPNFANEDVSKIAAHSESKFIFVSEPNVPKVANLGIPFTLIDTLVSDADSFGNKAGGKAGVKAEDKARGKAGDKAGECPEPEVAEDDVASIIYTSGTTGDPKGVMLTHRNLIWNADACSTPFIHLRKGWKLLSILPLAHVYEFTIGLILPLLCGCHIVYFGRPLAVSPLMSAFKSVRPRIVLSVPMLIEKIYAKAVEPQINDNPKIKRMLKLPLVNRLVYSAIRRKLIASLGGRLVFFGIGGAALDKQVEEFLFKAHFPYALGYGMTETSPFIAGCGPKDHKLGTLGKPLKGLEVKFDSETGELITRSPAVMKGYYKNPRLTAEVLSDDGWLKTGDTGYLDGDRIVLNGRIKEMILTASGENIFPEAIESIFNRERFVQESLIIPRNGGLLALIKLDMESFAQNMKLSLEDAREQAIAYIQKLREEVNKKLPLTSRVSSAEIQDTPFERTPTMKIKRLAVIKQRK